MAPLGWRLERSLLRIGRSLSNRLRGPKTVYVTARANEYRRYWEAAAVALGARLEPLGDDLWEIRKGDRVTRVSSWVTQCDDPVTLRLAGDKSYTYSLARTFGLPIPDQVIVTADDLGPARALLERLARAVVVKPLKGSASALGVTTQVTTMRALRRAALLASLYHREILVEEMIPAESCRLLFLDGRLLHAVRRRGVRITGDGSRSIGDRLAAAGLTEGRSDPAVAATLARQGLTLETVLPASVEVVARNLPAGVRGHAELRTVYDEDITAQVAPALVAELAPVVEALGSEFAGVDVMTNDPGRGLSASGGTFLEINTTPGLHHHYLSATDVERGPAVAVLAYLLGKKQRISAPSPAGDANPPGRSSRP